MRTHSVALIATVAGAVLGGVLLSWPSAPTPYQIPTDLHFWDPVFRYGTLTGDDVADYVGWCVPGERVVVGLQERNPETDEWERQEFIYSTSFSILDVAGRLGGNKLFVSGVQIEGDSYTDLIEEWTFAPTRGSYEVQLDPPPTARGVPRPPLSGSIYIPGGTYIPQGNRGGGGPVVPVPVPRRRTLQSVAQFGHFDSIVADPEGRFLLLHSYATGDLYSLDLMTPGAVLELEYSSTDRPVLHTVRTMTPHDVPGVGRVYCLSSKPYGCQFSPTHDELVLIDADNDGYFDTDAVYTDVDIHRGLTPLGDTLDWRSVTNFGWDWEAEYR
ncbi:MAG: hypothetical protein AB1726_13020 [Planctomycetota bacterium]